jgi:hypothetical protein
MTYLPTTVSVMGQQHVKKETSKQTDEITY